MHSRFCNKRFLTTLYDAFGTLQRTISYYFIRCIRDLAINDFLLFYTMHSRFRNERFLAILFETLRQMIFHYFTRRIYRLILKRSFVRLYVRLKSLNEKSSVRMELVLFILQYSEGTRENAGALNCTYYYILIIEKQLRGRNGRKRPEERTGMKFFSSNIYEVLDDTTEYLKKKKYQMLTIGIQFYASNFIVSGYVGNTQRTIKIF